jgi:N12 class adenine-specific DNA methylase
MAYIAALLDKPAADAIAELGDRVFREPGRDWVSAEEYLSGNVRAKLVAAAAAAESDPGLARNVTALTDVQPVDVVATDLEGTLGAPWVDERYVTEFARSLSPGSSEIRGSIVVFRAESTGQWEVTSSSAGRAGMRVGHAYGAEDFDALRILQDRLNGRPTIITHINADGKSIADPEATASAAEKAEAISDAFDKWLLVEDPERGASVLATYNERFNAYVARSYAGLRVDPPGLRDGFVLRPHQHQAIARMVHGGNTLLAHPVGAGKTAELIVGAFELRRLGTINLPAFVVPNHMLEQFSRDIVDLYPSASVLTIDKDDINPAKRALFAARVQSNDWDAVVITHSSFTRWPLSPEVQTTDIERRLAKTQADLARLSKAGSDHTLTKALQKRLASQTERVKALASEAAERSDDHPFFFDESGIDWIGLDEAQEFKNAELESSARNIRGVPITDGSQRSQDLSMKLRSLQTRRPGMPVVTFATGTPVSNTAAEVWVLARYLRPDLCNELGVANFDDFRAQFCDTSSAMELDPSGTRLNRVERLSRYKNLPELARMIGEFADIVHVEDLDLPRPALVGGDRRIVVIEPDPGLAEFMATTVSRRAESIRKGLVDPHDDNMLKLTSDCRLASFDWASFSGQDVADRHSMLVVAANQIAEVYHAHRDDTFVSPTGRPHPKRGSLQLVFSDLGTPKAGAVDTAYERLRGLLVDRGVPGGQIGFIHDHDGTDEAKARFFEMCRDGRIAVAMSSTAKMGIGTNVQDRLVALHHLDVPWRPSDVEQREGRILRQGNQHAEVEIFAYATERSFSTFGWQTIERKAGFIGQLMRADPAGPRTLDPADEETLSYGQIKALSTGDPAFLEQAQLEDTVARLSRLERAHSQEIAALGRRQRLLVQQRGSVSATLAAIKPLAERVAALGDGRLWRVEVAGRTYDNRGQAARALSVQLPRYGYSRPLRFPDEQIEYGWQPGQGGSEDGRLALVTGDATRGTALTVEIEDRSEAGLMGALTRATNQVRGLPGKVDELRARLEDLGSQLAQLLGADRSDFARHGELIAARQRLAELSVELAARYAPPDPPPGIEPSSGVPGTGPMPPKGTGPGGPPKPEGPVPGIPWPLLTGSGQESGFGLAP